MAAPVFRAAGTGQTSTGAALSVPWPVHNPDDLGLLVVETTGTSSTMTTPTGWTAVAGTPLVDVASVAGSKFYVFYRRATTSSEPDVATGAQTDHQDAMIYTYRGVLNTGSPVNVSATATKAVASLTATCPTITTTSVDCLIVLVASRPNDSAATNHFANPVNAALTSLGEAAEWGTIDGDGGGFVVSHGTKAVAGVVGTSTMAKGSSTTDCTLSIALAPMPTPPSAPTYRSPIRVRRRVLLRPNRRRGPTTPLTQTAAVTVTWTPSTVSRRRPARPLLRRRSQPTVPPTQAVVVVASWVPAVVSRRRPHRPLLRRRGQPQAPLTQTAVVVAVYVPPIPRAQRRFYEIRRGLTTPTPPAPVVVTVTYVPPITGRRRPLRPLPSRRRVQPATPVRVTVTVPAVQTRRRGLLPVRRRTQPATPIVAAVTVVTVFVPAIGSRRRYWLQPSRRMSVETVIAVIIPPVIIPPPPPTPKPVTVFTRLQSNDNQRSAARQVVKPLRETQRRFPH